MDLNTLSSEQQYYLNMLTKYTGRTNRLKLLNPGDMSKKKEVFISENMVFLPVSDQVAFNDCKMALRDSIGYCKGVFIASFMFGMFLCIMRTSATKSLGPGSMKSGFFALVATAGYYQYNYWEYQKGLHKIYVKLLNRKRTSGGMRD